MSEFPVPPLVVAHLSSDALDRRAAELAVLHVVRSGRHAGVPLLQRLRENRKALLVAARTIAADARAGVAVSPAADWLTDNFGLVEEQLREIEEDLPFGFYLELPKLRSGPLAGFPRVYAILWVYVEHSDSRFDLESLTAPITAVER